MPKIIDSVRERLLAAARKQVAENGYAKTTIRSVASECGIAVGTVYNYFPSKDMLIASYVAEDWEEYLKKMTSSAFQKEEDFFRCIYDSLTEFSLKHASLFSDTKAVKIFSDSFSERHPMLRKQIASIIQPRCEKLEDPEFIAQFIAESLLTWTMAKIPFDSLYSVIQKIINA